MSTTTDITSAVSSGAEQVTDQVADKAEDALDSTKRAANNIIDAAQTRLNELRDDVPNRLARAAAQVDEFTRRGLERARQTSLDVRDQVYRAGDRTADYIRDEPMKSVLVAAACGAALAALISIASRRDR